MTLREKYRPLIKAEIAAAAGATVEEKRRRLAAAFRGDKAGYQYGTWCDECAMQLGLQRERSGGGTLRAYKSPTFDQVAVTR